MVLGKHPSEYWTAKLNILGIPNVIRNTDTFKEKLGIGKDAYDSLRRQENFSDIWAIASASGLGGVLASSSFFAGLFFAPTGALALVGLGTAVTPVGWVIAIALLSGVGGHLIREKIKKDKKARIKEIPLWLNTRLDVLALSLLDLMVPLALKIALIDDRFASEEKLKIRDYFIREWGYYPELIDIVIPLWEEQLNESDIEALSQKFMEFSKINKDCNLTSIGEDFISFINKLGEADGKISEPETLMIKKIERTINKYSSNKNSSLWVYLTTKLPNKN